MVYLDYSATTPVHPEVLETYVNVTKKYFGNPNSSHRLGRESNSLITAATEQIASLLSVQASEIIYTSGATESNNLALKGIAYQYKNRGNHIITSPLEHSSVVKTLEYLKSEGFEVDVVTITADGLVDLEHLKSLMRDTTILVSICCVNSEIGVLQPISEISKIIREYPKCFFHVDATQSLGKHYFSLAEIDLASFSAQKFYGMKGIGLLYKRDKIELTPIFHGGKSTTLWRSGTPATPLIVSLSKAIRLSLENLSENYQLVQEHNDYLKKKLSEYEGIFINSTSYAIPHILNISILGVKPDTLMHALEAYEIYISSQSACSGNQAIASSVYALTKDEQLATSSLRISLSHMTTKNELHYFLEKLFFSVKELRLIKE